MKTSNLSRYALGICAAVAVLAGCGGSQVPAGAPGAIPQSVRSGATRVYQPLALGDSWTFICNQKFTIMDRVIATRHIKGRLVYALSLQIPSSPTKSTKEVQLLANDVDGNTRIYGYLVAGKVHTVVPAKIVVNSPVLNAHYDYPGPTHGKISRVFKGFEYTNRTPLGVFWVAPYFESGGTHNYGYSLGRGVMEEDHGPNYEFDCLIEKLVIHK
jgi:hypothetical protein